MQKCDNISKNIPNYRIYNYTLVNGTCSFVYIQHLINIMVFTNLHTCTMSSYVGLLKKHVPCMSDTLILCGNNLII